MLRITAIISAFIILLQSGGIITFLLGGSYLAKLEMQEKLVSGAGKADRTVYLTFPDYKTALRDRNEVYLNGRMYDVLSVGEENGLLKIELIDDENENKWLQRADTFIEKNFSKPVAKEWLKKIINVQFILQVNTCYFNLKETPYLFPLYDSGVLSELSISPFLPPKVI